MRKSYWRKFFCRISASLFAFEFQQLKATTEVSLRVCVRQFIQFSFLGFHSFFLYLLLGIPSCLGDIIKWTENVAEKEMIT